MEILCECIFLKVLQKSFENTHPGITNNSITTQKSLARDNHPSLFVRIISDEEKKSYTNWPQNGLQLRLLLWKKKLLTGNASILKRRRLPSSVGDIFTCGWNRRCGAAVESSAFHSINIFTSVSYSRRKDKLTRSMHTSLTWKTCSV